MRFREILDKKLLAEYIVASLWKERQGYLLVGVGGN